MEMLAENCDWREKKSVRKGKSEDPGKKEGRRGKECSGNLAARFPLPAVNLLQECSVPEPCALQLQLFNLPYEPSFRAQLTWNPLLDPVLPWPEVSMPGLCSCCPLPSLGGFLTQKVCNLSLRPETSRPVCRTRQEKTWRAHLQAGL